jgi:trehalose synthase
VPTSVLEVAVTSRRRREILPIEQVEVAPLSLDRFAGVIAREQQDYLDEETAKANVLLDGRVIWNVNSTARGGGVAEMLRSLIAYGRAAGVDVRWVVMGGEPDFFRITKRIHNNLHGHAGDGGPLGDLEREIYEATATATAGQLAGLVRPGDVVLLHDPQTAGLVPPLVQLGAHVVWRAHIGLDLPNELARNAWRFLLPYVTPAAAYVFSRRAFAWEGLDPAKIAIVRPSIDPFSAKNQDLAPNDVGAILHATGLLADHGGGAPVFTRTDGTHGRIDRRSRRFEDELLPDDVPVVTQVSRWDRLKDPLGVIEAFVSQIAPGSDAHLVIAGPDTAAVADDPEGAHIMGMCRERWESLAPEVRRRVHLALIPMDDAEENAAIVNALQRWSTVVVQKSLAEGFGLTVSEAMWKARPVVASRVGGIQDQIVDGDSGVLVEPRDLGGFAHAVLGLLHDPERARRMGEKARERVRDEFLGVRHLEEYVDLFAHVIEEREEVAT